MHRYFRRATAVFALALCSCGGDLALSDIELTASTASTQASTSTEPGTAPPLSRPAATTAPAPSSTSTTRSPTTTAAPQTTRAASPTSTAANAALAAVRANLEEWVNEDADFSKKDADCLVNGIIGALGSKRLIELGLDKDPYGMDASLTTAEARTVVDAMMRCVDLKAVLLKDVEDDEDLTAAEKSCVKAKLTTTAARDVVTAGLTEVEFESPEYNAVLACISP